MELGDKRTLNPHDLSRGEKQRLALLIDLLKDGKLCILDEPIAGFYNGIMLLILNENKEKINKTPIILIIDYIELIFQIGNTAFLISKEASEKINVYGNEGKIIDFFNSIGNEDISSSQEVRRIN